MPRLDHKPLKFVAPSTQKLQAPRRLILAASAGEFVSVKNATEKQLIQGIKNGTYSDVDIYKGVKYIQFTPKLEQVYMENYGSIAILGLGIVPAPANIRRAMGALVRNFDREERIELKYTVKAMTNNKKLLEALTEKELKFYTWLTLYEQYAVMGKL
jgi:hypothetical protein